MRVAMLLSAVLAAAPQGGPASLQPMGVKTLVTHEIKSGQAIAVRVAFFNGTIRRAGLPGKVVSCSKVIDLIDPSEPTVHNYGAICKIRFGSEEGEYAICDGEDKAYPGEYDGPAALGLTYSEESNWLSDFTRNNCV